MLWLEFSSGKHIPPPRQVDQTWKQGAQQHHSSECLMVVAHPPVLLHGQTQAVLSVVGDFHAKTATPHGAFVFPSVSHHTWSVTML